MNKETTLPVDFEYIHPEHITRRDYFAAMAMQALLIADPSQKRTELIMASVLNADELIETLDNR